MDMESWHDLWRDLFVSAAVLLNGTVSGSIKLQKILVFLVMTGRSMADCLCTFMLPYSDSVNHILAF